MRPTTVTSRNTSVKYAFLALAFTNVRAPWLNPLRLLVAAGLLPGVLAAWELSPKTLAERVDDASLIVVARVAATHSRKDSSIAGVGEVWDVTLGVTRTLKGKPPMTLRVTFVEAAVQDWPAFRPDLDRVWLLKAGSDPRLFAAPASHESVLTLAEEPRVSALLFVSTSSSPIPELRWGGPGFDPALKPDSTRFSARPQPDKGVVDLWIDSKETWKGVGIARIVDGETKSAVSPSCSKAMRHVTAPWVCSFADADLEKLSAAGKLRAFDRSGHLLLEESVSVNALRSLISDAKRPTPAARQGNPAN